MACGHNVCRTSTPTVTGTSFSMPPMSSTIDDGVVKTARTAAPALSDVLGGLSGTKCMYLGASSGVLFQMASEEQVQGLIFVAS
jgi:hypothetical protein